ncbi:MAG: excinuclease ABC subunit UvrC [Clostridia bacterium]|nr:excinuclease ABC subunit UvrC [Clostridia bacterium]
MDLVQKLKSLPTSSGVYLMKNDKGQIIYVGKAKNLKNIVNQYFQNNQKNIKTLNLVKKIHDFDTIICSSELDALCLESRLIKKYQPFYNILLKDGKNYPYIRLDTNEPYAVPSVVRKVKNDGAKYFGPFMLGVSAYQIVEIIQYAFGTRFCTGKLNNSKRECLNYHLKLCSAPCTNKISVEDYKLLLDSVEKFLKGDTQLIKKILQAKMNLQAEMEQFEMAIKYREQLKALDRLEHKYTVELDNFENADIFGTFTEGDNMGICVMIYRNGRLFGKDSFVTQVQDSDSMLSFIGQYYQEKVIPKNIYLSENFVDSIMLCDMLSQMANKKIEVKIPQKAIHKKLVDLAVKNACEYLEKNITLENLKNARTTGAVLNLQKILGLKNPPIRIEGFDISNISGVDKVSSMVVFTNGEPHKKHYRKFKIKTVDGANDFASMHETLTRRLSEFSSSDESFSSVPNLILIDGGLGQLHAVCEIINKANPNIEVISLAEKEELIFTPYSNTPIRLKKSDYSLQLLQRVRDESHRFAITFFKQVHEKNNLKSQLDNIEGVGKVKRMALLNEFGSINAIKNASMEKLVRIKGISPTIAQNIINYFNKKE